MYYKDTKLGGTANCELVMLITNDVTGILQEYIAPNTLIIIIRSSIVLILLIFNALEQSGPTTRRLRYGFSFFTSSYTT